MLSKTRGTPVRSPAPGVIPDAIAGAASNGSPVVTDSGPMTFLIYEDNGGGHHWTIVADGGEILARSDSFASHEQAKHAASIVHHGASRASFEDRSSDPSPTAPIR